MELNTPKLGIVLGFSRVFWALHILPTPRPGLTLVGAQAHRNDQHQATPFALHAAPKSPQWLVPLLCCSQTEGSWIGWEKQ